MTKTIEIPTIILPKEADFLIKNSYKKRKNSKKVVKIKKNRNKKNLEWLNEI